MTKHPDNPYAPRTAAEREGVLWTLDEEEAYASGDLPDPTVEIPDSKMYPRNPPKNYGEGSGVLSGGMGTMQGPRVLPLPGGQYPPVDFQRGAPERITPRAWHDEATCAAYDLFILLLKAEQARERGETS